MKQQALKEELQQKHFIHQADQSISEASYQTLEVPKYRKFNIEKVSANPESELQQLIGLADVKAKVEGYKFELAYDKQYKVGTGTTKTSHMRFVGNPGTGKTTIGRILAGILYREQRIPKNKYVEISTNDIMMAN